MPPATRRSTRVARRLATVVMSGGLHGPRHFARRAGDLLRHALPQCCALCAIPCGDALVCAPCAVALPRIAPACPRCALPLPAGEVCGRCLVAPPPQVATLAVFAYAFPVDLLLQRLKYAGALPLAAWAAQALADDVAQRVAPAERPGLLAALPLAPVRQRERGFNQAHEIARRLAPELGVPLRAVLQRVRTGAPQAALPWSGRAANVRGAFVCTADVTGRHVALVDDVLTTGATSGEAARTLLAAGAARVSVWVIARTLPPAQT